MSEPDAPGTSSPQLQGFLCMAPGGVEPPHADSKSAALSAELRGQLGQGSEIEEAVKEGFAGEPWVPPRSLPLYPLSYGARKEYARRARAATRRALPRAELARPP